MALLRNHQKGWWQVLLHLTNHLRNFLLILSVKSFPACIKQPFPIAIFPLLTLHPDHRIVILLASLHNLDLIAALFQATGTFLSL